MIKCQVIKCNQTDKTAGNYRSGRPNKAVLCQVFMEIVDTMAQEANTVPRERRVKPERQVKLLIHSDNTPALCYVLLHRLYW